MPIVARRRRSPGTSVHRQPSGLIRRSIGISCCSVIACDGGFEGMQQVERGSTTCARVVDHDIENGRSRHPARLERDVGVRGGAAGSRPLGNGGVLPGRPTTAPSPCPPKCRGPPRRECRTCASLSERLRAGRTTCPAACTCWTNCHSLCGSGRCRADREPALARHTRVTSASPSRQAAPKLRLGNITTTAGQSPPRPGGAAKPPCA